MKLIGWNNVAVKGLIIISCRVRVIAIIFLPLLTVSSGAGVPDQGRLREGLPAVQGEPLLYTDAQGLPVHRQGRQGPGRQQ